VDKDNAFFAGDELDVEKNDQGRVITSCASDKPFPDVITVDLQLPV